MSNTELGLLSSPPPNYVNRLDESCCIVVNNHNSSQYPGAGFNPKFLDIYFKRIHALDKKWK